MFPHVSRRCKLRREHGESRSRRNPSGRRVGVVRGAMPSHKSFFEFRVAVFGLTTHDPTKYNFHRRRHAMSTAGGRRTGYWKGMAPEFPLPPLNLHIQPGSRSHQQQAQLGVPLPHQSTLICASFSSSNSSTLSRRRTTSAVALDRVRCAAWRST